jgi:hypothetical protein
MIYTQDKRLLRWQKRAVRLTYYVCGLGFSALYWYARKRGEQTPPYQPINLGWVWE